MEQKATAAHIPGYTPANKESKYFSAHITMMEYSELSEQYLPSDKNGRKILETALMHRACEDVVRILRLREEKPPLAAMVRDGMVGEDLLEKLLAAEKELDAEIGDLVSEADIYKTGWGEKLLQEASILVQKRIAAEKQQETELILLEEAASAREVVVVDSPSNEMPQISTARNSVTANEKLVSEPILDAAAREALIDELLKDEEKSRGSTSSNESKNKPKNKKKNGKK